MAHNKIGTYAWAAGLLALLFSLIAHAGMQIIDSTSIKDEERREAIVAATTTLATTPTDMPALETLLQCLGPEVVNAVGVNTYYSFTDPVKKKADAVLSVWYSTDFLAKVLEDGSDLATYWSLRKIRHQEINSYEGWKDGRRELSTSPDLIARKALVTPDVKRALIPTLKHLMQSPDKQTADFAAEMVKDFGLLIDRQTFLESLADPDEQKVANTLSEMMETTRIDPLLTEEIWSLLNGARTYYLKSTCLRYPWLFEIKTFDAAKQRTLVRLLEDFSNGIGTNLNTALILLARSDNPLAERILQSLASCDSKAASARMNKYVQLYEAQHGGAKQPAAQLQFEGAPSD